jgi:anti-sigma B factor antagonist
VGRVGERRSIFTGDGRTTVSDSSRDAKWPLDFSVHSETSADGSGRPHVVVCAGELDMTTGPQLREVLGGLSEGDLIVDLSGLSFIDSTGISILLNTLRRLDRAGHKLAVVCPAGPPRRVFELTGLEETLRISDALDVAQSKLVAT